MKSCTHYPVGAPQSLFVSANLHRPNYLTGQPVLFLLTLITGLLLVAIGAQAQPFNQSTLVAPDNNPLKNFDATWRSAPVFVDIDNDCDKDCFVGNLYGEIRFYKNIGTASSPVFVEQFSTNNPMGSFNVASNAKPVFIDIDADEDFDCIVGAADGTLYTFKNTGSTSAPSFLLMTGVNTALFNGDPFNGVDVGANSSPAFLDLDFDGDFDCFIARSASTNSIRYFRNDGDQSNPYFVEMIGSANPLMTVDINSNASLTTVNLDGDGDMDIYAGVSDGTFKYYQNEGNGTFTAVVSGPLESGNPNPKDTGPGSQYSTPAFVDIDGDGDVDCFSGKYDGVFVYYRNDKPLTARTISCQPYSVTLNSNNGLVTVVPNGVDPDDLFLSSTFNCPNELSFTISSSSNLSFTCADASNTMAMPLGTPTASTLTLQATDGAGNTATCTSTITVLDKTPPTPSVQTLPVVTLDKCSVGTFPASYTPTATDACSSTVISGVATPSTLSSTLGTRIVTWTYTDSHNNSSTQTQVFNVVSNVAPSFAGSCPTTQIDLVSNQTSPCGYQGIAFTAPTATDCNLLAPNPYTSNFTPTSFFPTGINNVTYAAVDSTGNIGYCNFTVRVRDGVAPVATFSNCPTGPATSLTNIQNTCGAPYSWIAPTYSVVDNCDGPLTAFPRNITTASPIASGAVFPVGTTTVGYVATDVSGNSTVFCIFMVTVVDNQPPSITCPSSITVNNAPGTCGASINVVKPAANDNCSVQSVTETGAFAGATTPRNQVLSLGTTTFSFMATDASSNTVACTYNVTVVDNEAPKFTNCPQPVSVQAATGACGQTVNWITPSVTDNCNTGVATGTYAPVVSNPWAGTATLPATAAGSNNTYLFKEGLNTVTYTVSDGAIAPSTPNTSTCTFTVKVTNAIAPTITCPTTPIVVSPGNECLYTLTASNLTGVTSTASTDCDPGTLTYYRNPTGATLIVGTSTFGLGTSTVTARATDASGSTSNCTFSIQVVDQTAPVLSTGTCPINRTVSSDPNLCGINITWTAPVYSDNCSQNIIITRTITPGTGTPNTAVVTNNNGGFFPVGTTTVNFIAKDSPTSPYINVACSVVVTVEDKSKPQFTNCPSPTAPIVVSTDAIGCTANYSLLTPIVTDNCPSTLTTAPAYTVTYTLAGVTTATATTYTSTPVSLNLGNTTVTYTAVDNATPNNSNTCTFVVKVVDQTPPTLSCANLNQTIVATSECVALSSTWMDPVPSDNCSGISSFVGPTVMNSSSPTYVTLSGTSTARSGSFPAGNTILRYTATDNAGITATCTFTIFVQENIPPVITCPANITVSTDANACTRTLTPSLLGNGASATDNCTVAIGYSNTLVSANPAPVVSNGGTYTVTYTATDASGNTAACTQLITVADQVKPLIVCPAPWTYTIPAGNGNSCVENGNNGTPDPIFYQQLPKPTVTDNCTPAASLNLMPVAGQPGQYCANTINALQWKATDANGNMSTCSQQITIAIACTPTAAIAGCNSTAPVTLIDAPGCPASVAVTPASLGLSATDNCGNTITITPASVTLNATNVAQSVTFTATAGTSTTTCVKSITVNRAVEVCGNGIDDDCNPATPDVCPCPSLVPVFVGCNAGTPVTLQDAPGCPASLTVNAATFGISATDNCGNPITNITPASITLNATGLAQNVTFTVAFGQSVITCVKSVTVTPAVEVCGNGIDDDCDGLVDAADPDCGGGGGNPTACAVVHRTASDGLANDYYGSSVDVDADIAVVGAYYDDNPGMNSGSVYVLERGANDTWVQVAKLSPTDGTSSAGDWFGRSVAVDGNYIVVGAPQEGGSGAVYVFRKGATAASWTQVARLVDPTGVSGDQLGYSVDVSSDYIIAGAPNDEPASTAVSNNNGSVSIYQRNVITGAWALVGKRVALDAMPGDAYGSSVSIDGDYAAVGAPMDDYAGNKTNAGSVYVLENQSNAWAEIAHQHASDYLKDDNYGTSVSISGGNLLVGAPMNDISAKQNAGSVYVHFQDEGGPNAWGEIENLIADDFTAADQFGISVSVDGDVAVIGAHFDDIHGFHSGSAYIFDGSGGWLQVAKLDDVNGDQNDNFGYAVGLSGTTVIVGAWKDDILGVADQGSVSIFDNCSSLFRPEAADREEPTTASLVKAGTVLCSPNPSTDIINIDVTLAQEEAARITVCDATGRLIETIFDGKADTESRFQWDGGRYGRGMYFIRVQSASVTKVVSVTILR